MHVATLLAPAILASAPTPSPTPSSPPPELVTPGPIGFTVMAVLAIAVILLVLDMLRRVRRARYRDEVNEELDLAESQARDASEASTVDDQDADPGRGGSLGDGRPRPGDDAPR